MAKKIDRKEKRREAKDGLIDVIGSSSAIHVRALRYPAICVTPSRRVCFRCVIIKSFNWSRVKRKFDCKRSIGIIFAKVLFLIFNCRLKDIDMFDLLTRQEITSNL